MNEVLINALYPHVSTNHSLMARILNRSNVAPPVFNRFLFKKGFQVHDMDWELDHAQTWLNSSLSPAEVRDVLSSRSITWPSGLLRIKSQAHKVVNAGDLSIVAVEERYGQ